MPLKDVCPAENAITFMHVVGLYKVPDKGYAVVSISGIKSVEDKHGFIRFNFCPFCGEGLANKD